MSKDLIHRWQQRLLIGLCCILALSFTVGAVTKFYPGETFFGPAYSEKFEDWGYPSWFRFVVGSGELLGAVLLLLPRLRFLGATALVVILVGAVLTHIANQNPLGESVAAPVCLALVGGAAWASRPESWSELWGLRRGGEPRGDHSASQRS